MLVKTTHSISPELIQQAKESFNFGDFRTSINQSTGNFFYDPWVIKDEFKNTIWEQILETLPYQVGEARVINLKYGICYQSHSDIDDRYHMNIQGDISYLVNLDTDTMYRINTDGFWYDLDAGYRHSAVNVGYENRIQLVVRKLLLRNQINNSTDVEIKTTLTNIDQIRFMFDNSLSGLLNRFNKRNIITNFKPASNGQSVQFAIDTDFIPELEQALPLNFYIESK